MYAGAMRGYEEMFGIDDNDTKVWPFVAPYITWDAGPVNPQVFIFGEAVAVSIRIKL